MSKKIANSIEIVSAYFAKHPEPIAFNELWEHIKDDVVKHEKTDHDSALANLYSALMLDNRFILNQDSEWTLRQFLDPADQKKHRQANYLETTEEFSFDELREALEEKHTLKPSSEELDEETK